MKTIINIKATNMEMGDQIKSYVDTRINSLVKFIDATEDDEALFEIEIGKITTAQHTGKIFRAEINLRVHGNFYRAEETEDSLNTAIDLATGEIEKQLRRGKKKRMELWRRGAQKIKNILKFGKPKI